MANPLIPNLKQTTPVEVDTMDSVYIKEQAISLSPIGDIGVDRQDVTYEKSQATPLKQFNTADLDKQELTYISNQSTTNTISIPSGLDAQISTYQLQQTTQLPQLNSNMVDAADVVYEKNQVTKLPSATPIAVDSSDLRYERNQGTPLKPTTPKELDKQDLIYKKNKNHSLGTSFNTREFIQDIFYEINNSIPLQPMDTSYIPPATPSPPNEYASNPSPGGLSLGIGASTSVGGVNVGGGVGIGPDGLSLGIGASKEILPGIALNAGIGFGGASSQPTIRNPEFKTYKSKSTLADADGKSNYIMPAGGQYATELAPDYEPNSIDTKVDINYLNRLLENMRSNNSPYTLDWKKLIDINYNDAVHQNGNRKSYVDTDNFTEGSDSYLLDNSRGFSGPAKPDSINSLSVIKDTQDFINSYGGGYNKTKDIIAFYFHDLVNDRYIPFRATVKGIQESLQADWSEVKYIGRADKLYNYRGFSRTLQFQFSVVASSLSEMVPMWQRINYLITAVKPANYTTSFTGATNVSNFIIPPMMTVTIGDMYKEQPIIIDSVGLTIPDDALWETVSENESDSQWWSYFNNIITIKNSKNMAAQFPRNCDISIQTKLIEQDIPKIGGHNLGGFKSAGQSFSKQLLS